MSWTPERLTLAEAIRLGIPTRCRCQRRRRNLTPEEDAHLMGMEYETEKNAHGALPENTNAAKRSGEKVHSVSAKTAEVIAKKYNVSPKTVQENAKFARAVNEIAKKAGTEAKAGFPCGCRCSRRRKRTSHASPARRARCRRVGLFDKKGG